MLAQHLPPPPKGRIICLAAGKGAAAMAAAAEHHYLDTLGLQPERLAGLATTRHGHSRPTRRIEVIEAGHPVPDASSQRAAERTLALAQGATADDLVLVLLTGGGSANWIAPVEGLSLPQKQDLNRALLRSGAPIGAMNTVRKHLSRIKGGRLARAARPAAVLTLAISDVPHDDPAVIASGPTVADPTTLADARAVLQRFGITPDEAIAKALQDPANESCKAGDPALADCTLLADRPPARCARCRRSPLPQTRDTTSTHLGELEGEAREVAAAHAQLARAAHAKRTQARDHLRRRTDRHRARPWPRRSEPGIRAGAAFGLARSRRHRSTRRRHRRRRRRRRIGRRSRRRVLRCGDVGRRESTGLDPDAYLANNDATAFFEKTGDLLTTGPTLTNVNDVRVILVDANR